MLFEFVIVCFPVVIAWIRSCAEVPKNTLGRFPIAAAEIKSFAFTMTEWFNFVFLSRHSLDGCLAGILYFEE